MRWKFEPDVDWARRRSAALLALCVAAASPAAAQPDRAGWERDYRALLEVAEPCRDADRRTGPPHVINPEREARRLVERMLAADPGRCPGVREAAYARLRAWVGEIERADADADLLRTLYRAADQGLGTPRDPALADRIGRLLWLFERNRPRLTWSEAERWDYLIRPESIALLEARARRSGEYRAQALLGEARLRRGSPAYDPAGAVDMLERSAIGYQDKLRVSGLLTDGELLPRDYERAGKLWLRGLQYASDPLVPQRELLRIGRLAAAAARTPAERAAALRILWAASIDDLPGSAAERDSLLARLGTIRRVPLAPGDGERVHGAIDEYVPLIAGVPLGQGETRPPPMLIDALIGPDGRVVMARVVRSSSVAEVDRRILIALAEKGSAADLSATAGGRFVWTRLPPVPPKYP